MQSDFVVVEVGLRRRCKRGGMHKRWSEGINICERGYWAAKEMTDALPGVWNQDNDRLGDAEQMAVFVSQHRHLLLFFFFCHTCTSVA